MTEPRSVMPGFPPSWRVRGCTALHGPCNLRPAWSQPRCDQPGRRPSSRRPWPPIRGGAGTRRGLRPLRAGLPVDSPPGWRALESRRRPAKENRGTMPRVSVWHPRGAACGRCVPAGRLIARLLAGKPEARAEGMRVASPEPHPHSLGSRLGLQGKRSTTRIEPDAKHIPCAPAQRFGRGCQCPGSRAMGASAARMAKRSGHAESRGLEGRGERPATGHGSPDRRLHTGPRITAPRASAYLPSFTNSLNALRTFSTFGAATALQ
jgi:hypothetical protein